ncbi:MAG: hypothetical protein V3T23_05965 [Nitrososphaerales archaeon]
MFNNVHIIAVVPTSDDIIEWDVRIVSNGKFVGVIEKFRGPGGIEELAGYWFTDTFGRQSDEFNTLREARDYAERSINPVTVN